MQVVGVEEDDEASLGRFGGARDEHARRVERFLREEGVLDQPKSNEETA